MCYCCNWRRESKSSRSKSIKKLVPPADTFTITNTTLPIIYGLRNIPCRTATGAEEIINVGENGGGSMFAGCAKSLLLIGVCT